LQRTDVVSSNLQSVGYDERSFTLEVQFRNGSVYELKGVPRHLYDLLIGSPSKGQFFNEHIKDKFPSFRSS